MYASSALLHRVQDGWTPLHAAAREGHLECMQLLADRGAEIDAADKASPTLQLHHHKSVCSRRMCDACLDSRVRVDVLLVESSRVRLSAFLSCLEKINGFPQGLSRFRMKQTGQIDNII
jgi:hypothetical protein